MAEYGIAGLFGPQYGDSAHVVQDICDLKEIPHVQTQWDPKQLPGSCSINFHPYPKVVSQVRILDNAVIFIRGEIFCLNYVYHKKLKIIFCLGPIFPSDGE